MARHKDGDWNLPGPQVQNWQQVEVALLMDIRDELKELNRTLSCFRVRRMSDDVNRIDKRLQKAGMLLTKKR